jgi:four helix bundle protein
MKEKAFRKLIVWKRARTMTPAFYRASEKFPRHEIFGLTSQVRRSVVSVGANIAEGYALGSSVNYLRYLNIAIGSVAEIEYHLEHAHYLSYLNDSDYAQLCDLANEVGYLLSLLNASIERNIHQVSQKPQKLKKPRSEYVNFY